MTIMAPMARPTIGGTAAPGMGYEGLVTMKIVNTRKAVPKASMKNAWYWSDTVSDRLGYVRFQKSLM
jgi:hypothetical protein